MKKLSMILVAVFVVLSFSSCRKCTTCTYNYPDGFGGTLSYTYPEICGKSKDINAYKDACEAAASAYGESCNCD